MAVSAEFRSFIEDHFADLGPVRTRAMFGGAGVYLDGVMFALLADDVLYLKTDEANRADFEAEGLQPFLYEAKGKVLRMSYWRAPERLLEDRDEAADWGRKAVAAALRGKS